MGKDKGAHGYTVRGAEGITVTLADDSTNGLTYDWTIYTGSGEYVTL